MRLLRHCVIVLAALALVAPDIATAQISAEQRLRQSADSLARIRRERDQLQQQMKEIQGRARNLGDEVNNIIRQTATTQRLVRALDTQFATIAAEVDASTASLIRAQDELAVKQADTQARLVEIYKRGPLNTLEVLLSAESFSNLIARYKYLQLQTQRDRAMLVRIVDLKDEIERQRALRLRLQDEVGTTLAERAAEERRYRALEQQQRTALQQVQQRGTQTERRLSQIAQDEQRMNSIISAIEAELRRAAARPGAAPAGASVFRPGAGLDWPVNGELVFRFGNAIQQNNTMTKWNGVGISAPLGTAVRAVADGRVVFRSNLSGYGLTIMLSHPSGDFTVYGALQRFSVDSGAVVSKGQVIGTVGNNDSRLPPHLHFEVRLSQAPAVAVDPMIYLRPQRED